MEKEKEGGRIPRQRKTGPSKTAASHASTTWTSTSRPPATDWESQIGKVVPEDWACSDWPDAVISQLEVGPGSFRPCKLRAWFFAMSRHPSPSKHQDLGTKTSEQACDEPSSNRPSFEPEPLVPGKKPPNHLMSQFNSIFRPAPPLSRNIAAPLPLPSHASGSILRNDAPRIDMWLSQTHDPNKPTSCLTG